MRVSMFLCEAAQVAEGKLNVLGAGWSQLGSAPAQMAVAVLIEFDSAEANGAHHFELFLTDREHQPVFTEAGGQRSAIEVRGDASVELPAGYDPRLPVPWPIAINVPGVALPPDEAYQWNLVVDGHGEPAWTLPFRTAAAPANGSDG